MKKHCKNGLIRLISVFLLSLMLSSCASNEESVFITPKGKRYHKETCRTIQGRQYRSISKVEAIDMGKTPCHVCFKEDLNE
ncbi:MAG: hypothetical protein ACI30M_04135 [Muribaculaceae bacterium]